MTTARTRNKVEVPEGTPILALAIGLALAGALIYGYTQNWEPAQTAVLKQATDQAEQARQELTVAREVVARLPENRTVDASLAQNLDIFRTRVPERDDLAGMLRDLTGFGQTSGAKVQDALPSLPPLTPPPAPTPPPVNPAAAPTPTPTPTPEINAPLNSGPAPTPRKLDLNLNVTGSFAQVYRLFEAAEKDTRLYRIGAPEIVRQSDATVNARFTLSAYSLIYEPAILPTDPGPLSPGINELLLRASP